MTDEQVERSPSGSPIYRYGPRRKPFEPAVDNPDAEKIEQHVEKYIGKIDSVYHELVSDLVHIDILWVKPTPQRNFHTLITCGMSSRPMNAPPQVNEFKYAELLICLPPDWPLADALQTTSETEAEEWYYWPIRVLKTLARFPHAYNTWLWYAHTVPNGDPPAPFADNTELSGVIIGPPLLAPEDFFKLVINPDKVIYFLSVLPLYKEEMEFKLAKGADALFERLDKQDVTELLDIHRPNVCKRSFGLFRKFRK